MINRRLRRKVRIGVHSGSETRSKTWKLVAVCAACLVVVVLLTVLLGYHLKNKAEAAGDATGDTSVTTGAGTGGADDRLLPPSNYIASAVPVVKAGYVMLSSSAGINWGDRAAALKVDGVGAVSLILYYGGGTVNYSSKTAQAMAFQSADTSKTNLYEAIGVLNVAGIHTSGCFYVNYTAHTLPSLVNIYREYEAALVAEAVDAGFSDVTLFGFKTTEADALEASDFIERVRSLKTGTKIGIALPQEALESAERETVFANFARVADYLAVDLSSLTSETAFNTALDRASGLIKKYNLRIIVSDSLTDAETLLNDAGYSNWQIVP